MRFEERLRLAARQMCVEAGVEPNAICFQGPELEWEVRAASLRRPLIAALPDLIQEKQCLLCEGLFICKGDIDGQRKTRVYCSDACRVRHQRLKALGGRQPTKAGSRGRPRKYFTAA